jgi:hypothetical protein
MKASDRRTRAALHAVRFLSTELLEADAVLEALRLARDAMSLVDAAELVDRQAVRAVAAAVRSERDHGDE